MTAGFDSKAAFVREADLFTRTWPSVSPAVAGLILPLLAESIGPEVGSLAIAPVDAKAQSNFPRIVSDSAGGDLLIEARYSGLEFLLAAALGFEAKRIGSTLMPESLGGGAFRHLIEIDNTLHGDAWRADEGWIADDPGFLAGLQKLRRGTYVIDKGVLLWETLSAMLLGLTINGNGNGLVTMQTAILGNKTSLGTIVSNDLSGLACSTERVLYTDMTFQVAPLSEAPLVVLNTLEEVTGFNITLNNNISALLTKDSRKNPDEPSRTGPVAVTGGFAIPTYADDNDDLSFSYQAGNELIGLIEFVGPEIASSGEFFTLRIYMPSMKITGVSIEVGGPGQLQQNYQFTCTKPDSTPTGFPANVKNSTLMIELINDVSTHPLIT